MGCWCGSLRFGPITPRLKLTGLLAILPCELSQCPHPPRILICKLHVSNCRNTAVSNSMGLKVNNVRHIIFNWILGFNLSSYTALQRDSSAAHASHTHIHTSQPVSTTGILMTRYSIVWSEVILTTSAPDKGWGGGPTHKAHMLFGWFYSCIDNRLLLQQK